MVSTSTDEQVVLKTAVQANVRDLRKLIRALNQNLNSLKSTPGPKGSSLSATASRAKQLLAIVGDISDEDTKGL